MGSIHLKRVYEPALPLDGLRILAERLWPRGLSKERARVDVWCKDIAPSSELRKWYAQDPARWLAFRRQYIQELNNKPEIVSNVWHLCKDQVVTLVYASREQQHNSTIILKEFLEAYAVGMPLSS